MVSSAAKSVAEYLAELPPERREVVASLRKLIVANLPPGYEEAMNWGMLCYQIPLASYPNTYNGQPLGYVSLAAQKNAYSLYLSGLYAHGEQAEARFRAAFERAGRKLDMGKSCVRFRRLDDLPLDVIAAEVASIGVDEYIRLYEKARAGRAVGARPVKAKPANGKSAAQAGGRSPSKPEERAPSPVKQTATKRRSPKKSSRSRGR